MPAAALGVRGLAHRAGSLCVLGAGDAGIAPCLLLGFSLWFRLLLWQSSAATYLTLLLTLNMWQVPNDSPALAISVEDSQVIVLAFCSLCLL